MIIFSPITYFYTVIYLIVTVSITTITDFFFVWMIIELQMISLVAITLDTSNNSVTNITSYFLYQSVCSLGILFAHFIGSSSYFLVFLFMFKLGVFPFSAWYVNSLSGLSILPMFLTVTLQNLPVILLVSISDISPSGTFIFLILCSVNILFTSICSIQTANLISSFVWLTVASTFWIVICLFFSWALFYSYFFVYCFVLFFLFFFGFNNNSIFVTNLSLLALSGLPPFPDFFINLFIVYFSLSISSTYLMLSIILITLMFNTVYMYSLVAVPINHIINSYSNWLYSIINVLLWSSSDNLWFIIIIIQFQMISLVAITL